MVNSSEPVRSFFSPRRIIGWFIASALIAGLYLTTRVNYLFFHVLVELFSVIVAASLAIITWNSREYIKNQFFLLLGIAYLFIGAIDLLHTLTFVGMNIFPGNHFYANQLWIGGRYLESLSLLAALLCKGEKREKSEYPILAVYTLVTGVLIYTIFVSRTFPPCYIQDRGQTPFKIISEYIIVLILLVSLVLIFRRRDRFDRIVFLYIVFSMVLTIFSELAFTQYVSNYGAFNLIGHFFKLLSFIYIYKSVIETGIRKPFDLIFREVDELNTRLNRELELKTEKEAENEKLIGELKEALAQVKTLGDLLPVCMHCKKVRDDRGYWKQIDEYIALHTDTQLSHGICPDCIEKYYPEMKGRGD